MSDSQAYEEVTVSSDGVTVTKRFEKDEFPVPAIAFEFESSRDEEVRVRLSDTVPDDIEVEDLGFHPEYGSEYWTIDDDRITFERTFAARASYTTVYGIRATGSDNIQQFLAKPTIEEVDPPLPDEAVVPESGDDVVKNAIAGDGEIPGLEDDDEEEADDEDVATLDLKDPSEPESGGRGTGGTTTGGTTDGTTRASIQEDSLIAAIATEIREKEVSAEDVKLLRQAFEIAAQEGGSTAAKIEQIQSDVADLRAYTGSLEEFLDENGTAQEMLDDFERRVESFDRRLEEFESNIEANSQQLSSIDDELGSMSEEVTSVRDEVDSIGEEVESVSGEVDSIGEEVESVSEDVESVTGDVQTLDEEVVSVREEVEEFDDEIAELKSAIDEIEATVGELEEQVTDEDVADRLGDIEESVDDLRAWQEQIKQTFGG